MLDGMRHAPVCRLVGSAGAFIGYDRVTVLQGPATRVG
jgi:hypothetical protein